MSKLFEEAIAEAKQLRELAEQNAKNAIVEAVTPRIREFIEEQLLAEESGEMYESEDEDDSLDEGDSVLEDVVNEIMAEMAHDDLEEAEEELLTDADGVEEAYELDEDAMTVLSKMLNERSDLTPEEQKLKSIVLSMHSLRSKLPGMNEAQRKEVKTIIKKVKNQILTNEGNMTKDNMHEVDLSVTEMSTGDIAEDNTVEEALNELRLMLDLGEPDEDGEFDMANILVTDADAEEAPEDEEAPEGEEMSDDEELGFELEDEEAPLEGEEAPEATEDDEEMLEINEESLVAALREMKSARTTERTRNTNKTNESAQIATLNGQVAEYAKVINSLREQLTEMNLFNAKLLYVNKLVQDKNVTSEQRRGIVESLDGAKTLREVKLLYKGLTKSLKTAKTSSKKSQISEAAARRSIGSSSRPAGTKSTQKTLNESTDSTPNRWATLAGLNKHPGNS
jgi:ribosomal protein S20